MADFSPGSVPFYFVPIPAGMGPQTPIHFMSTIDSYTPSFGSSWESSKDMGRPDPKYMYSELTREVAVAFKVVALSTAANTTKMRDLINSLVNLVYPVYKGGNGYNGIYVRMVIGDLFNEIGHLTSVNPVPTDDTYYIDGLPVSWDVDISFTTMGETKPKWQMDRRPLTGDYETNHGVY